MKPTLLKTLYAILVAYLCNTCLSASQNQLKCIIRSDLALNLSPSARTTMLETIADMDYISGFHVIQFWKNFEPTNNNYDHSIINECISIANSRGKRCSVAFAACWFSPSWLMNALGSNAKFTFTHPHASVGEITSPIPWNNTYKTHLNDAINALSTHDGSLDYVVVTGPSTLYGIETNFPLLSIDSANANKLNFSRTLFENEWKNSIDSFSDQFPNTTLGLTLHTQIDLPNRNNDTVTPTNLRSYILDLVGNGDVVIKLAGLFHNSGLFPGPFIGHGNGSAYQELITPVKELENVSIAFEVAQRLAANNVAASNVKQIFINGLSFDGNEFEVFREDIYDAANQTAYGPYAPQANWLGNHGINQSNATHETGDILSSWSSRSTTNSNNLKLGSPGLAGTNKSLIINSNAAYSYVTQNLNLAVNSQRVVKFRFYLDPNSIAMNNSHSFRICRLANTSNQDALYISLQKQPSGYRISSRAFLDSGSKLINNTGISDAPHFIEVTLYRSASATATNGWAEIKIDDVVRGKIAGLDNYDRFSEAKSISFGNCYVDNSSGTTGNFFIDEVKIQGHGEYIGPRYQ